MRVETLYIIEFSSTSFKCPKMSKSIYFFPFDHPIFYIYLNDYVTNTTYRSCHICILLYSNMVLPTRPSSGRSIKTL